MEDAFKEARVETRGNNRRRNEKQWEKEEQKRKTGLKPTRPIKSFVWVEIRDQGSKTLKKRVVDLKRGDHKIGKEGEGKSTGRKVGKKTWEIKTNKSRKSVGGGIFWSYKAPESGESLCAEGTERYLHVGES